MVNVAISSNDSLNVKVSILDQVTFSFVRLYIVDSGKEYLIDTYNVASMDSEASTLSVDTSDGSITISLNSLPIDSIYYKDFVIAFYDNQSVEIDRTHEFSISPKINKAMYGVAKKLEHDFAILCRMSGSTFRLFVEAVLVNRCPECWDFELEQRISSTCSSCGGEDNRFITTDFCAKKVKTSSKQVYTDRGKLSLDQVMLQTYSRLDFRKGTIFVNLATKDIYEVVDRTIASIGNIRTSTLIVGKIIEPNDSRVASIKKLI